MTGLVLEGGGMRGLFSAGVMDVMMENGIRFDGIIGVSAGATFGCNYKSLQPGRVLRYNMRFKDDPRYMGWKAFWKTGDFVTAKFSYHYLPEKLDIFDKETFANNPAKFYLVTTDVETGKPCYRHFEKVDYEMLEWLRASASLPILSTPVELEGHRYLDGGISDSIPLRYFQGEGFDRNVVILTQPLGFRKKRTKLIPLFKATMRRYPAIIKAMERRHIMYNEELDYLAEQTTLGNTLLISPDAAIPIGRTSRNGDKMQMVYEMGRKTGEAYLERIKNFVNP